MSTSPFVLSPHLYRHQGSQAVATPAGVERFHALQREQDAILSDNRTDPLSEAEQERLQAIEPELDALAGIVPRARKTSPDTPGGRQPLSRPADGIDRQTGRPVHFLSRDERFTDLPTADGSPHEGLSFGKALVGLLSGRWQGAEREREYLASMAGAGTAGTLVGDQLLNQVIDKARAMTCLVQAGAKTLPMTSDHTIVARVNSDPSMQIRAENSAFSLQDVAIDSIGLTAFKIGAVISMSRELVDDAVNAPSVVEGVIAKALATELDRLGLAGVPNEEPAGLLYKTGIGSTDSVGAIAWEDLLTAIEGIESSNHQPNAWVVSPQVKSDLAQLTSGDGTNSAKLWLPAPDDVKALRRFVTSNCPTANLFLGDFSQFIIGLRQEARIETSTEAGDAFEKHQLYIKIVWRGDFALEHGAAFHVLKDITT